MAKGSGNPLDAVIQTVLYVCFSIYLIMGISLIATGAVYAGDAGAVSSTATGLLINGVIMLLIGGLAMFANYGQNWLLLIIVECINVLLFLFLTTSAVIAMVFAMGYNDPIADLVKRNWREIAMGEAGGYNANPKSVCFRYVTACDSYGKNYATIADKTSVGCRRTVTNDFNSTSRDDLFQEAFSNNDTTSYTCNWASGDGWSGCSAMSTQCTDCNSKCQTYLIREAKSGSEAAAAFTIVMVLFTVVACVWNNFLTLGGNDEFGGITELVGLVLNGIVFLVGLAMCILCGARLGSATGYTTVLLVCLLLGVFLLLCGGACMYGVKADNAGLINIGNIFLGIFGYVLLIMAVALAVCTGTVMQEANGNYDQNYIKLRTAMEKVDPGFCKIPLADCKKITTTKDNTVLVTAGNTATHDADALWNTQFLAIQSYTSWVSLTFPASTAPQRSCISTAVCVACKPLISNTNGLKKCGKNPSPVDINDQGYYDCVDLAAVNTKLATFEVASPSSVGVSAGNMTARDEYMKNVSLAWRNRTKYGPDRATRKDIGNCEKAVDDWSADNDEKTGTCQKNADCSSCDTMVFNEGANILTSGANKSRCIRAMYAIISASSCNPTTKSAACRANFFISSTTAGTTQTIAEKNFDDFAGKMPDSFCQFTDESCQTKLTQNTEDELGTIGIIAIIFCVSFAFILYATVRGIVTYKTDDDE